MNKKIIFGVMLVCLLAFGVVMAFSQSSPSVRWEYRSFRSDNNTIERADMLGREGWELVTIGSVDGYVHLVFKRRLP
jgi:hypothetical protein